MTYFRFRPREDDLTGDEAEALVPRGDLLAVTKSRVFSPSKLVRLLFIGLGGDVKGSMPVL